MAGVKVAGFDCADDSPGSLPSIVTKSVGLKPTVSNAFSTKPTENVGLGILTMSSLHPVGTR